MRAHLHPTRMAVDVAGEAALAEHPFARFTDLGGWDATVIALALGDFTDATAEGHQ